MMSKKQDPDTQDLVIGEFNIIDQICLIEIKPDTDIALTTPVLFSSSHTAGNLIN